MDPKVKSSLEAALRELESERSNLDRQIAAVRAALGTDDGAKSRAAAVPAAPRKRRTMSAKARRLISARMKAVWAKRRGEKKPQPEKAESKRA